MQHTKTHGLYNNNVVVNLQELGTTSKNKKITVTKHARDFTVVSSSS